MSVIEAVDESTCVVGTAHVSQRSVEEVEATIRERRPDEVHVELDEKRFEALRDPDAWQGTDIVKVLREKKQHLFLVQLYLANMQARIGAEQGVAPGSEMLAAIRVADEIGAKVVLIDRDVSVTLKRGFGAMGFWRRIGLFLNILAESLPQGKEEARPSARKTVLGQAAFAALVLLLLGATGLGARLHGGVDRVLDALIGFPSFPVLTVVLAPLAAGLMWGAMEPRGDAWHRLRHLPLVGLGLGLLADYTWRFTDAMASSFATAILPLPPGPAWVGLGTLAVLGLWGGVRIARGARRFQSQRSAIQDIDVDAMLDTDAITAMTEEFSQFAPTVKVALIDERDAYMSSHIHTARTAGKSVVAVVGAGHMPGILAHLAAPAGIPPRAALDEAPAKRLTALKVVGWLIPLAVVAGFVLMLATGRHETFFDNLLYWVLVNGTLSALGAAIALAHPLSILVAFIAAPITSLNPTLAAGWFAGLTEAKMRTPKVADFQAIRTAASWRDFYKNPVIRILLVTALANLGSMVGTWLGLAHIIRSIA